MNDIRQSVTCPINVPSGTPVTVANVSPVNIKAIALARLFGSTTSAAMTEAMDINTPCANAEIIRPINKIEKFGAIAAVKFPIIKIVMTSNKTVFRLRRDVKAVNNGAPTVTPNAYIETVKPAVLKEIPKSFVINGKSPTLINSVDPIPKALIASASKVNLAFGFFDCDILLISPLIFFIMCSNIHTYL